MRTSFFVTALTAGLVFGWAVVGEDLAPTGDAVAAIGLATLVVVGGLTARIRTDRIDLAVFAMLVWAGFSAIMASEVFLASKVTLGWWSLAAGVFWMVRPTGRGDARVVEATGAAIAMVGAMMVTLEAIGLGMPRASGFIVNGNLAAGILMAVVLLLLSSDELPRSRAAVAGILILGVAASGSRAAVIALLAAVIPVLWGRPALRRPLLLVAGLLAAVLVWRLVAVSDSLAWYRWSIWRAVLEVVAAHPVFGTGLSSLADATGGVRIPSPTSLARYGRVIGSAESSYLGLVVRAGLPVLVPVAWAVWSASGLLFRRVSHRWPLMIGLGVFSFFHDLVAEPAVLLVFAAVLGAGLPRTPGVVSEESSPLPRGAAALFCGWFLAWSVGQPALVRARWFAAPDDSETVVLITRAEPMMVEHLEFRLDGLLRRDAPWTWDTATEALAVSDRCVNQAPGRARAWSLRAHVAVRISQDLGVFPDLTARARDSFAQSIELEPFLPWDRLRWAIHERSLGRPDRAHELVRQALDVEPNLVSGWALRAQLALDRGDAATARIQAGRVPQILAAHQRKLLLTYERQLLQLSPGARAALDEALP